MSVRLLPLKTLPTRAKKRFDVFVAFPIKAIVEYNARFVYAYIKNTHQRKTVLFYPEKPKHYHVLYKVCKNLGWRMTNNIRKHVDYAVFFEDTTLRPRYPELDAFAKEHTVVNSSSCDIQKSTIDTLFKEVFGYGVSVDPRTHRGACVRKSNINALHDGVVVECPTEPETGYVYQKLINTACDDGRVMDIRIPIFGDSIPHLIKRYKFEKDIFDETVGAEFAQTDELLSKDEQEKIVTYCKKLGVDYGELDALRSNEDGKLYIVDVNNTPAGPIGPLYGSRETYARWLRETSKAFKRFLQGTT